MADILYGKPRFLQLGRGLFIDLDFAFDKPPESTNVRMNQRRSISGKVESRPERAYDTLRCVYRGLTETQAGEFKRFYDTSLKIGEPIEVTRDSKALFNLCGDVREDQWRGLKPAGTPGIDYELMPVHGFAGQGGIGVFSADSTAPDANTRCNWIYNGDFIDGVYGQTPTGWTNASPLHIVAAKSGYFVPGGKSSAICKISGISSAGGTLRQDITLAAAINTLGVGMLSFNLRADVGPLEGLNIINIYGGPVDGADPMSQIGAVSPTNRWRPINFRVSLGSWPWPTTTDNRLRLEFRFSADVERHPTYLDSVQLERRKYWTGFRPRSLVRSGLDGKREVEQGLQYLNPAAYAHQIPTWYAEERFALTVAFRFASGWETDDMPESAIVLYEDTDETTGVLPALQIFASKTGVSGGPGIVAQVTFTDGSQANAQASYPWFPDDGVLPRNFLVSYIDWDGATPNSGKIKLAINLTVEAATSHSKVMRAQGAYLRIGGQNPGDPLPRAANGVFSHVRQVGVYVDESGPGRRLTDFYTQTPPTDRLRRTWRVVLSEGAREGIVQWVDGAYNLDAPFVEIA